MKIVTAAQMQELDRRTIEEAGVRGTTLMNRAGTGVVSTLEAIFGSPSGKTISIFCGKGNNGGDGFVVARLLRRKHATVQVCLLGNPAELKGDAKLMYTRFTKSSPGSKVQVNPSEKTIWAMLGKSHVVVDALLGTGISSPVKERYRTAIEAINDSGVPTVAVDLPSGIHTDTGAILGSAVRATLTVTFGYPKLGLYLGPAIDFVGQIHCVDIGIPDHFIEDLEVKSHLITAPEVRNLLPSRPMSSHKGTFGHAGIIAGSPGKTGAAALGAIAALRVGTGLVTVGTPSSVNPTLEAKVLEAMTAPLPETEECTVSHAALTQMREFAKTRSAIAIGPGLTTHPETTEVVRSFIPQLEHPFVVDADGLNALVGHTDLLRVCKSMPILTPHPGEMARLIGQSNSRSINNDRLGVALRFAQAHGTMVVLKGARTIIAGPNGLAAICPTGNPGMATAGMGDVLTGMLVGLLAQGLSPWDAARAGVFLHGLAGDLAAQDLGQAGMIAGDLLDFIPHAIVQVQQEDRI